MLNYILKGNLSTLRQYPDYLLIYNPDIKLISYGGSPCNHTHKVQDARNSVAVGIWLAFQNQSQRKTLAKY